MMKKTTSYGFTLIEVMISVVVLVLLMAGVFQILANSQTNYDMSRATGYSESQWRNTIDDLNRELIFAKIDSLSATYTALQYKLPVDWDNDNDVTDATGVMEYGYANTNPGAANGPRLNWYAVIDFVPTKVLLEPQATFATSLPIERYNFDLNKDGDMVDVFYSGQLVRYIYASAADLPLVGGTNPVSSLPIADNVILNAFNLAGDVNGDGTVDKLFRLLDSSKVEVVSQPAMVQISPWVGTFDADRRSFYLRNSTFAVAMRNPQ